MKVWQFIGAADDWRLVENPMPEPKTGASEVLIKVHAAGVTPTEVLWYPTWHGKDGSARSGAVPAHEFSGKVAAVGGPVSEFAVGDSVYGMNDWFAEGALAGYCATNPQWIAPKPQTLTHEEAASVPIGALTAWQGLIDRAKLQRSERLLVHGGAGAVGIFAVQLAKHLGAIVTATASAANLDFVRSLGAAEAYDYRTLASDNLEGQFDVVFDCVGGETLDRSWALLKPDGRLVTIAAAGESATNERKKQAFLLVEPRRDHLVEIGKRIDSGELKPVLDAIAGFSNADAVYTGTLDRRGRGKVVVRVT